MKYAKFGVYLYTELTHPCISIYMHIYIYIHIHTYIYTHIYSILNYLYILRRNKQMNGIKKIPIKKAYESIHRPICSQ